MQPIQVVVQVPNIDQRNDQTNTNNNKNGGIVNEHYTNCRIYSYLYGFTMSFDLFPSNILLGIRYLNIVCIQVRIGTIKYRIIKNAQLINHKILLIYNNILYT